MPVPAVHVPVPVPVADDSILSSPLLPRTAEESEKWALPPATLLAQQAAWLAPARAQLLRRVAIARRQRVLELGAGSGAVTPELVRRSGGTVVATDIALTALREHTTALKGAWVIGSDARWLPFANDSFDLVFCQLTLLWIYPTATAIGEIWRVLEPGGVLIALEPDYGGMIEYPPEIETRHMWVAALVRAGADPHIGRKLPNVLKERGFQLHVELLNELRPPALERLSFLQGLPLTNEQRSRLAYIKRRAADLSGWSQVAHLPFFLITARKP